jgi:hypothetical protein
MDETQLSHYLRELYPAQLLYQFSQLSRQQSPWPTTASSQSKHIIFGQNIASIPYLPSSQEPPILQNPERVVRHTENERFDRSYQPNVALAPRQTILVKERDEREHHERSNSVIKREIQIKQERPSTPNNEHQELRHNSPETTVAMESNVCATGATVPPISPEGQSGSNEITSSTSPVPVSNNNTHHHHQIPNKRESETPPSQPSPPTAASRSHTTTTTLIKTSPSVVVKVTTHSTQPPIINGKIKTIPLIGNPEFELSTDTDEESLGEPDSSHNGNPPQSLYEFVASLLKTNSSDDHSKILDIIKYMEKEITQLKEAHKKDIRERQQMEEALRKENERLQHQLRNNNVSSVIAATASCLSSSSSSSSSSSLSSSFSYDYDRSERRNSINEKQNVIIKPPKKSLLRITPQFLDDSRSITVSNNNNNSSTSTSNINNQTSSVVIMPKSKSCEDAINNNSSKAYNNNSNNNDSVSNSSSTNIINGNQTDGSTNEKQQLQKTAVKSEKL